MNRIKQTSPDKVHGKLVKYRQGDCLSIKCGNGKYLGVLISEKFNAYYDLTLIEFYEPRKPKIEDFINGKFFGTRFGSWENLTYATNRRMLKCKYIDNNINIDKIGTIKLIEPIISGEYSYFDRIEELHKYYLDEISIRIEKSKNAEKYPDLAFVSRHLIDTKYIIAK